LSGFFLIFRVELRTLVNFAKLFQRGRINRRIFFSGKDQLPAKPTSVTRRSAKKIAQSSHKIAQSSHKIAQSSKKIAQSS
jgi:hypothetical protein